MPAGCSLAGRVSSTSSVGNSKSGISWKSAGQAKIRRGWGVFGYLIVPGAFAEERPDRGIRISNQIFRSLGRAAFKSIKKGDNKSF